ncbi:MAG: S8 family serine peptidase, partial [Bacteroidia bacterium]|nr:S8 family serine peptidase [Bacteroidia bacterium]
MSNLFFQFPHLGLLGVSLLLLLNGIFSKRLILQIISVLILVYAGYREILSFNPDTILHLSLDLILISILAFPAKFIDSKLGQVIYLLMALGLMGAGHSLIQINHEEDQSIEIKLDPDAELLVQFDNIRNLQTWKNKNKDRFDIEYPVFTPADEQYGLDEYVAINLTEDQLKEDYIREITDAQGVIHVEYNEQYSLDLPVEEAETSFQIKSELNDPGVSNQWMADRFKLDKFHEMISSRNSMLDSEPSIIAILDTGVDGNHEDLAGNYVSTKRSYDSDSQGHGTHCAGIAAAVTGNNIGIASWIPPGINVKVTGIKVLNAFGMGTQKSIVKGIIEAADLGASVISISLGGVTNDEREKAYTEVVKYATDKGSVVVVAAGNSNVDAVGTTPANIDGVITVTAINKDLNRAYFGNTVDNLKMGLAAPGENIFSTYPRNKYISKSGTSMAAPFASGIV